MNMINMIRSLAVSLGFLLTASSVSAQYVNVQVNFNTIKHWEDNSSNDCWEWGDEEYTALIYANLDGGSWQGGQCFQINSGSSSTTQGINYTPINTTTLATTLGTRLYAWEDDSGDRCSKDSSDDCVNDNSWSHTIRSLSRATWNAFNDYGTDNHRFNYSIYWNWIAPTAPAIGSASSVANTSFTTNWSNSDGNYRVTSYRLTVATDSGFGNIVSGYNNLDVGTATSRSVTGLTAGGTYYFRVTAGNEAGTSGVSGTGSTTLPKYDQTITFTAPTTKTYGDADFAPGATASSGLTVSYNIVSGPASIVGNNIRITGAGTVNVRASQAGDASYNAAPNVDHSFTVNAKGLTITAAAKSKVYGDGDPTLTYSTSGLIGSDSASGALTRDAGTTIGTYAIRQGTVTAGGNYSISYSGANLTITPKQLSVTGAAVTSKSYDGSTAAAITGTLSGVVGGDTVTLNGTGNFVNEDAGTGKSVTSNCTLGGAAAFNYTLTQPGGLTGNITARLLAVTATGINKPYDGNTDAIVTLSDNRLGGDDLTVSYASASFDNKNVGTGKPVSVSGISVSGTDAANYSANTTTATTADITARLLAVTATGINKAYDGNTDATVTLSDDRFGGDDLTVSYASASFDNKNVGTGKPVSVSGIALTGPDAANYSANATTATTADITARALLVTADAKSKIFDETDPALTFESLGLVSGDAITGSLVRDPGENAGTYTILQGTLDAGENYALSYTAALFTILKADQAITFEAIADKTTADAPFSLVASVSSGLPISFTSLNPEVATVSGSTVTIVATGSATIRATQAGDANYNEATNIERTFSVGPPPNQPPAFAGMTVTTLVGSPVMIYEMKILARASDPENETVTIAAVASTTPGSGTVSSAGGTITYTPLASFSGSDSISVTLTDGTNSTVVLIAVVVEATEEFSSGNPARISTLPGGGNRILFSGIPGRTYAIQRSTNMSDWDKVGEVTAAENSTVTFDDATPPQPSAFYRIAYPAR